MAAVSRMNWETRVADPPPYPGLPRWVIISGILAGLMILLVIFLVVFGGGQHGPFRHLKSSQVTNFQTWGDGFGDLTSREGRRS